MLGALTLDAPNNTPTRHRDDATLQQDTDDEQEKAQEEK